MQRDKYYDYDDDDYYYDDDAAYDDYYDYEDLPSKSRLKSRRRQQSSGGDGVDRQYGGKLFSRQKKLFKKSDKINIHRKINRL